ncbi:ubiE/COQ5 methyltransferase [Apiospora marii]|uniref:UbiE/COQ5 methyltransferase n=1 Tax=Apiospora marii TaxID=335849 RepID=A0ABR1S7B9_9PEZI
MPKEQATYSHGHHQSVVTSHARRTVHDSAAFLAPHLKPTDHILDIGCGPGSITCDFAALVPEGRVVGVDAVASVLDQARALANDRQLANIEFEVVDANALPYPDATFDVVYCHQVLQHVRDPVAILREMRRVAKPGAGLVAAREADYGAFAWYPADPLLSRWGELYHAQGIASGGEPNAGRCLHAWARQAGFAPDRTQTTVTAWCYTGERARQWGNMWADRALHSGFAAVVKDKGLGTQEDLEAVSRGWAEWATKEDLFFSVPSTEILYRVPAAPATST